jgi:hypothetical protein
MITIAVVTITTMVPHRIHKAGSMFSELGLWAKGWKYWGVGLDVGTPGPYAVRLTGIYYTRWIRLWTCGVCWLFDHIAC